MKAEVSGVKEGKWGQGKEVSGVISEVRSCNDTSGSGFRMNLAPRRLVVSFEATPLGWSMARCACSVLAVLHCKT